MDSDRSLQTSFWVMVLLQTIGSIDMPGSGLRKMPAPRAYVPIIIVWAGLQIFSDTGRQRGAATAGWVMVLVGMVVGPFGQRLVNFINGVANRYGTPTQPTATTPVAPQQPLV